MPETLEDIGEKILAVEAKIASIEDAQRERGTPFTEREEEFLLLFNRQLVALREKENALRADATAAGAAISQSLFVLRGTILNGKKRAGCRFLVFEQAENAHGKIRVGSEDGIWYDEKSSSNLCFEIVFENKVQAEEFETSIKKIPLRYRKRPHSDELSDIAVILSKIETVKNFCGDLERISTDQFGRLSGTDLSPDFDAFSYVSTVVAVEVTEETRLRLLDREDSTELFRQKPEQCHIVSRKVKEYSANPNNIVFMSRSLHQQYDALDSTEGVSQFYLMYVRHDKDSHPGIVNGKPCTVFTTVVHVVFIDEAAKSILSPKFKPFTDMNSTTIELTLCFPNPLLFAELSSKRMEDTLLRWESYRGVES